MLGFLGPTINTGRKAAALLISALCGSVLFSTCVTLAIERPIPEGGGPTVVHTQVIVLDIDEIDSANQTVTLNFFVALRWHDPRLAENGEESKIRLLNDVWHPALQVLNQQKIWPTLPEQVSVGSDGIVSFQQRFWVPLSQPLDLREFPFDRQNFDVLLASSNSKPSEVTFVMEESNPSGIAKRLSLPDWDIAGWGAQGAPYSAMEGMSEIASYAFRIIADRQSEYYLLKVVLPLVLIVFMSWIVFWIDPKESGTQIGVATTSMLTLIAYRFMIGDLLPRVSYVTRLDYFILLSTILVFATLVTVVVTSSLAKADRNSTARRIDPVCRVAFPSTFVAVVFASFIIH